MSGIFGGEERWRNVRHFWGGGAVAQCVSA